MKISRRILLKQVLTSFVASLWSRHVFSASPAPRAFQHTKAASTKIINVVDFGAIGNGLVSDAKAFQDAALHAHAIGGARIIIPTPEVAWLLDYPVYLLDNTEFSGTGKICKIIYKNPTFKKGRGGFVIGSSREANRELALAAYKAGTYPLATTNSRTYVNPERKFYRRDHLATSESRNSSIHDIYLIAKFDLPGGSGGYGVNIVNAVNCHAYNIWGEGWCQLIGMGSDIPPETPSNHLCSAYGLHVIRPDPIQTYYSIGFIANSTDCAIYNSEQYSPITLGSPNGSGVATNFVENCRITGIKIPDLGRSATSEGILLNNAKGCLINNILIGNAKKAVSTFFTDSSFNDPKEPNIIGPDVTGINCDFVINLLASYTRIIGFKNIGSTYDVAFGNTNAVNNSIAVRVRSLWTRPGKPEQWYLQRNKVGD